MEKKAFAFWNIISVILREGITSIETAAFENCRKLTSINIPDSVTTINEGAFFACRKLKIITLSPRLIVIGARAFEGCDSLSIIQIDANTHEDYKRVFNLLPENIQQIINTNIRTFVKKAKILLDAEDVNNRHEFFSKQSSIANLAKEYGVPTFMINNVLKELPDISKQRLDSEKEGAAEVGSTLKIDSMK